MSYDWQSGAFQSIDSEVAFRAGRQAGSLTAQTYHQTRFQSCKLEL